jgi:hypothetical protein
VGAIELRTAIYANETGYRASTKKMSLHTTERDTPWVEQARTAYHQRTASLDLRRLKYVHEAGVNLVMTRLYGRAPRGGAERRDYPAGRRGEY